MADGDDRGWWLWQMVMMGDGDDVSYDGDNGDGGDKDKRIKLPYLFPRVTLTNYHRFRDL